MNIYYLLTEEQKKINNHQYYLAKLYFEEKYDWYKNRKSRQFIIHHKDETLKHNDIERYIQWNIEDLEIITYGKHSSIHHSGKITPEATKSKMSMALKGRYIPIETRLKMSVAKSKAVQCIETGEIYQSATVVQTQLGIKNVSGVCRGDRKTAGGYHWRYINEF